MDTGINSSYYVLSGESPGTAAGIHRRYLYLEWQLLIGANVDIRREGVFVRAGVVEDVTPSGETAWIAANGIDRRTMIEKSVGYELWISAQELQRRRVHQPRLS